jgi:DNA-binding MarR family transcriptional regulator
LAENLDEKLEAFEKRLKKLIKDTIREEISRTEKGTRFYRGSSDIVPRGVLVSFYSLSIPAQTTLLAIEKLEGKATIEKIISMTRMARSTEAKNLSMLRAYGYVEEEKSVDAPRKKIYLLTSAGKEEMEKLRQEHRDEIIKKRIKSGVD